MVAASKVAAIFIRRISPLIAAGILLLTGCRATGPDKVLEGERLLRQGKPAEALALLQEAVQMIPRSPVAWNYVGLAYHRLNDYHRAVQSYNYALTIDRNLAAARYNLGVAHLEHGNYGAAAEALVTFSVLRPRDTNGMLRLAQAYFGQSRTVAASVRGNYLEAVRKCLDRAGPSPEAYNLHGLVALQKARPRDAYTNFVAALQLQPSLDAARLNLAVLHQTQFRDPAGALAIYRELRTAGPKPGLDAFAIQRAIAVLEMELRPPPTALVATNLAVTQALTNLVAPTVTNKISSAPTNRLSPAIQTSAPPVVIQTNIVQAPPVVQTLPVGVEASLKKPVPPPVIETNKPALVASTNLPPTVKPVVEKKPVPEVVAREPEKVTEPIVQIPPPQTNPPAVAVTNPVVQNKSRIIDRLNPAKWFERSRPEPPKVSGENPKSAPQTNIVLANRNQSATPLPPRQKFTPFKYTSNFFLTDGDRGKAQEHFEKALALHRDGNLAEAVAAYQEAVKADPTYFQAQHNLALASYQRREFANALIGFEKALHIDPASIEGRYNFALALNASNHPTDAAAELERILSADNRNVKAHLLLANIYAEKVLDPARAKEHYRKVLELDPQHPKAVDIRYWLAANP